MGVPCRDRRHRLGRRRQLPHELHLRHAASWPTTIPVAGDWDSDGIDGIGTYTYATGVWQLRQTPEPLGLDLSPFSYRVASGDYPVVGDWNADGTDSVGVRSGTLWHLNNENDASPSDIAPFAFGLASDLPLVGGAAVAADVPPTAVNDGATVAEDSGGDGGRVLTQRHQSGRGSQGDRLGQ